MKSILGKFSKADPDGASPEVKQRYVLCEDNRSHMKKVQDKFHLFLKKNNSAIEEGREFAEAVQQYGESIAKDENGGDTVLTLALLQMSSLHKLIEDVRSDVHGFLLKYVDQPIQDAMEEEAETGQAIKRRYDKARVSFENLRRNKGSELQAEDQSDVIGDTSQQYIRLEEITEETIEALQLHQQQGDMRALAFACKYIEVVHTTFGVLHSKATELLPTLERHLAFLSREVEAYEIKAGRPFPQLFPEFNPTWSQANLALSNHTGSSEDEMRKRDIADLLKRERGYVNTLKSLTKIYLFEFRNNRSVTKSVTLQDLQDIFCNIEDIFEALTILKVHQDFAWELQAALDSSPTVSVGVLLVNFIPKLEVYLKYISNIKKSENTLRRLRSKAVAAAIRQCEEKDRSGLDFISLLALPTKHITKYHDLVANIFAHTPTSSSDYDHVDQAVVLLNDLNSRIEQAEQASEVYYRTEIAAASIESGEELIAPPSSPLSPSRLVINQILAGLQSENDVTPITLFLFSDQLIVCDGSKSGSETEPLKRRKTISLSSISQVSEATSISMPNALILELQKEQPLLVVFPSAVERSQWHREISDAMRTHQHSRAFGVPLEDLMTLNKKEKGLDVPTFITAALDTIDTHGLEVEGIFRVSGSVLVIRTAKEALNQGLVVDYINYDIHSVAGVVQAWLRELPEPLMTYKLYPEWVESIKATEFAENIQNVKTLLAKLPIYNRFILHHLCRFLNRVASFGKVNKMKSGNLAIGMVHGHSIFCIHLRLTACF